MVKIANILNRLKPAKILVIGDLMLDAYTIGKARCISPEAPVAVINVQREERRPGGAGNVVLNLLSLGAQVIVAGRVGNDWTGQTLIDILSREGVDTRLIVTQEGYLTPVKNRIIADHQQIVRIDHEQITPLSESLEHDVITQLNDLLKEVQVVAISDYGKGFLTKKLLRCVIQEAKRRNIPVITDPKGNDFTKYQGTTIIKPNLSEAYHAAKLPLGTPLEAVASQVLSQCEAELLMLTRSEAGISLFHDSGARFDFPVHVKEVKDVTGAGDTVLAMLAHSIANGLSYSEAAHLCNSAAGIAIEHVGCARVSLSDLAFRLFEHDMNHKIFDREHLILLQEILKGKPFSLLILSGINSFVPALFQSIKKISNDKISLLVFIDHPEPCEVFLDMLSSLREVSFITSHLESLNAICQSKTPQSTYTFDEQQELKLNSDSQQHPTC